MYYIYIIYSRFADKYYVGHSCDPWRRLIEHNNSTGKKYTGKHRPWEIKAVFEVAANKGDADRIEKFIKRQKSRKLIESLTDPDFVPIGQLAKLVRVPHLRD
ncbi:MAG: GIY-YIG nuclease family protein [Bacteroidales bacterium]|nr:GIY-YIG nuclease family protein [Bacteroidales bacterium]